MDRDQSIGDDGELVDRLRAGDEVAFAELIDRYYSSMLRVARSYVATHEAAEDVVQETFLGVIRGIDRFEARSSLKTWMFRILVNRAKTRGEREGRAAPFSSLADELAEHHPAVDPDRFNPSGRWAGHWASAPRHALDPEDHVLNGEIGERLLLALDHLPTTQRAVIELRDVRGFTSDEVCEMLEISEGNQRVLLHRARARARTFLEKYLDESTGVV